MTSSPSREIENNCNGRGFRSSNMTRRETNHSRTTNSSANKQQQQQQPSSAVSSLKSSSDPPSLLLEKEDPTELDLTETEHCMFHDDNDNDDDDQAVVLSPQEMQVTLSSILKTTTTTLSENDNISLEQHNHDDRIDDGLYTMEMLVEVLRQANRPDVYSRRRRLRQPNRKLQVHDLTKILSHVNICEAAGDVTPRWDVIYELAYGSGNDDNNVHDNDKAAAARRQTTNKPQQDEQEEEGMIVMEIRSSGSSRLRKLSYDNSEPDHPNEENPPRGNELKVSTRPRAACGDDSQSLSLGQVMGGDVHLEDNGSAFTLEANTHSVESSVTWYEGADITEIEITEDELEEFLPNYYGNERDQDEEYSAKSGGDSTPPPPLGVDILYTPPSFDFSLDDEQDSLSRCYRRRPRKYAETE